MSDRTNQSANPRGRSRLGSIGTPASRSPSCVEWLQGQWLRREPGGGRGFVAAGGRRASTPRRPLFVPRRRLGRGQCSQTKPCCCAERRAAAAMPRARSSSRCRPPWARTWRAPRQSARGHGPALSMRRSRRRAARRRGRADRAGLRRSRGVRQGEARARAMAAANCSRTRRGPGRGAAFKMINQLLAGSSYRRSLPRRSRSRPDKASISTSLRGHRRLGGQFVDVREPRAARARRRLQPAQRGRYLREGSRDHPGYGAHGEIPGAARRRRLAMFLIAAGAGMGGDDDASLARLYARVAGTSLPGAPRADICLEEATCRASPRTSP